MRVAYPVRGRLVGVILCPYSQFLRLQPYPNPRKEVSQVGKVNAVERELGRSNPNVLSHEFPPGRGATETDFPLHRLWKGEPCSMKSVKREQAPS